MAATPIPTTFPLSESRGKKWRRTTDRRTGLTYLTLPKGTILWRGYNPKQKRDRPQFFAFSRSFAERYGEPRKWKTKRALKLLEAHYPVELDECCLRNAYVLQTLAEEAGDEKALLAVREHMLKEFPEVAEAMALDSALAAYVCELGMDGWIRLGRNGNGAVDEVMLCDPSESVTLL